ncbi:P-loop containing nucleoside triphosphate hydrolase protein [Fusarium solani]|uniref:P-loop containing nucleoside triphosphate hydrolase protein n=1 Tax=Fusarium solani TaxID=169388 RepID=A0A9P9HAG6_FUSSL|nr:P-loop containing nucleoside triphosphate hydrolase protein [Fusarium solani]KAH7253014.1 P-loop containing nucleoside triphosphate hydrolase protein [Fusarium solani]
MELTPPESFMLSPNDVVIAVMGVTGAGKSTFIGKVTGQDVKVGHSLVSHTAAVGVFPYQQSPSRCVYLVDTPGFDDTTRTDTEVLKDVAFFLSQIYRKDVKLAGINLKMFQQLCGDEAFGHVLLATSMWDTLDEASKDVGDQREQELMSRAEFWGTMYKSGSQVARWLGNERSAQSIVGKIIEVHDKAGEAVLKIQQEMVNEDKDLDETAAGREVQREIAAAKAQLQEEIKELREMQEDMIKQSNEKLAQEFASQRQTIEKQLKDANEAQASLKISLETLLEEKTAEYEEMLKRAQEEQRRMAEALKEKEADIRRAQQERAEDEKMFREAQAQYTEEVKELARKIEQQQREAERQQPKMRALLEQQEEMKRQQQEEQEAALWRQRAAEAQMESQRARKQSQKQAMGLFGVVAGVGTAALGVLTVNPGLVSVGAAWASNSANNM